MTQAAKNQIITVKKDFFSMTVSFYDTDFAIADRDEIIEAAMSDMAVKNCNWVCEAGEDFFGRKTYNVTIEATFA